MTERGRTYRTDGGNRDGVIDFPTVRICEIPAVIKRIVTTDDGKVQIVLEGTMTDNDELEKIKDLVVVQQAPVKVDILGMQGELEV